MFLSYGLFIKLYKLTQELVCSCGGLAGKIHFTTHGRDVFTTQGNHGGRSSHHQRFLATDVMGLLVCRTFFDYDSLLFEDVPAMPFKAMLINRFDPAWFLSTCWQFTQKKKKPSTRIQTWTCHRVKVLTNKTLTWSGLLDRAATTGALIDDTDW